MKYKTQTQEDLVNIQKESEEQARPDQKSVISVSSKLRRRLHNLPDPTNPPLGYDEHKAFDRAFPYINIPALHPRNHGDTVIFNDSEAPANKLYLGDNLEVLRTLKSNSIDLIYIDPPFFSGRNYNVIWGDSNEVRTFEDIWEGGINSYLIWLNARLWEMRRVLKNTGSIYVHCDWHASHYIKTEMDKIFGYENFINEIVWCYETAGKSKRTFSRKHDSILLYGKTNNFYLDVSRSPMPRKRNKHMRTGVDENGREYEEKTDAKTRKVYRWYFDAGILPFDYWTDIQFINWEARERIGYPTQKPEPLLERITKVSSNENDLVADFFCGGGTTLAVAQKLKRRFIGCDSSRVAVSVTLDRLVKIGEEMSGVKSNLATVFPRTKLFGEEAFQMKLQSEGLAEKVPNIEVYYLGVYPVEKFKNLDQEEFIHFVLTAYGASRNTGAGVTHGYRPPAQQEPIYVGPSDPNESIDANGIKTLQNYSQEYNLPIELEAIPLDSKAFRQRILQRMPDVEEAELFLRFSKPPVIGDIKFEKVGPLEYEFETMDAFSTNEDGWLVNAQCDFDYQVGHFTADKDYVLSREKKKDKKHGEIFEAVLKARHKFEKEGEYTIACKVQDNLAGETILSKKVEIEK